MRAVPVWADTCRDKSNNKAPIYCTVFKPDGTELILGAANRVLVYQASDGELRTSLPGHKDTIYCVAYSKDMKRFASGDAAKTVIVWDAETYEGQLKYYHTEAIQCLAFNPVTHVLISCTQVDFGFWSPDIKIMNKTPVRDRVCCCSWTNDGRYVALGLYNGTVSIRDRHGEERVLIKRGLNAPIWSVSWNPSEDALDTLAVCDWNQKLSFYMLGGRQIAKDRQLDYDPCCVSYFSSGEFMVMGGSDKKVSLYTKEGVKLHTICEQEGWVWSCAVRPKQNYVAIACSDGTIALYQLIFSTVHGLYKDRYAYRKLMTDVILQDLTTKDETRIKCKDLVKKIAIYKDRLAVQLPNQILVYDIPDDGGKPSIIHRIREAFDCNLLVVCAQNIILCQEKRLQCLAFDGTRDREWNMDASIRYIKVTGGPSGREGLLVGLKNGQIMKIFADNPFPINLIKQGTPVRCLDLSASRRKLAVVDDQNTCLVYDLDSKELLFQEPHANSVAWNTQNEDMLCFSGDGMLHIKASDFPLHKQKLQGFVVGFQGSNIYCLHVYAMAAVEVPQSSSMHQYLSSEMFDEAYKTACLGVTDSDWRALGLAALRNLNLTIAKNCFIRVHDIRYLELVNNILELKKRPEYIEDDVLRAKVYAHLGEFAKAADLYESTGNRHLAMQMYSDLRHFEKAKQYLDEHDREGAKLLIERQMDWSKSSKDPTVMIDIYLHAGEVQQAIDLMGKNGMHQRLIDKARELNAGDMTTLSLIAKWLSKLGHVVLAAEVYKKTGDEAGLAKLYITHEKWDEAFALADGNPELKADIFLPYANYLAEHDRYEDAQDAFRKAGHPDKAIKVLQVLTHNAVMESRFADAAYYFWQLSISVLEDLSKAHEAGEPVDQAMMDKFYDYQLRADIYYAYDSIHRYTIAPFTSHQPESLFNIARYLYHIPEAKTFAGISQAAILYTLSQQSRTLEAYNVARHVYNALLPLKVTPAFRETIDLGSIMIRGKPCTDNPDLQPLCYRCSTSNPLIKLDNGLRCAHCGQRFVFSFHAFEVLPLIEFVVDDDIPDEEAVVLINDDRSIGKSAGAGDGGSADIMSLDNDESAKVDRFTQQYMSFQSGDMNTPMVRADREMLTNLPSNEIFIQEWPAPLRNQYYRNVLPEIGVALSESSNRFFHVEDYEQQVLQKGYCPFSRAKVQFNIPDESQA